jgi:predicted kinase
MHSVGDEVENLNGPYAHLRKMILSDSDRYKNYTKQRQWLQNAIIEDFLDNIEDPNKCITPSQPWLIFTVGARGAGKIHTMHDLVNKGRLPILTFVHVDPDSIRRRLPEFRTYDKELVNDLTRKESSFIAELLLLLAVQNGRNVVFDSSMRESAWFLKLIENIKCLDSSSFKFAVLHITAPTEIIFERVKVRCCAGDS